MSRSSYKVIIGSGIVILMSIIVYPAYELFYFHVPHLIELNKCPQCLGSSMCNCFINNQFRLNWAYFWTNFLNILYETNILFGKCASEMVVLKWNERGKRNTVINRPTHPSRTRPNINEIIELMKNLSKPSHSYGVKDFVLCPTDENLSSFLKPITSSDNQLVSRTEMYQNLLYSIQVNAEPLIQQVTSGWAVARYLGSCGDISVSEYCGPSLTSVFPDLIWKQRASVARQLLSFAFNATFGNPAFAFYFTDQSPDNFAVSDDFRVRLVDLDNVVVVDKNLNVEDWPDTWNTIHKSFHDENIRGFAFSTEELCSHKISDINIYSICQGILSDQSDLLPGGLLHSPPQRMTGLKNMIQDCVSPLAGLFYSLMINEMKYLILAVRGKKKSLT